MRTELIIRKPPVTLLKHIQEANYLFHSLNCFLIEVEFRIINIGAAYSDLKRKIPDYPLILFLVEENVRAKSTHCAGEQEECAELTNHIGNEGLACLGMPNESDSIIGNEVEEEIRYRKHAKSDNQGDERKLK